MTTPDPDLEPGAAVGEYVVEGKIGQGGFGAVFKATHPVIGKLVALKVLARKFSVDPEMVERFVAEARAVNQIRHRNIIDIFSFGQLPDGRHYYAMEYLEGDPLDAILERDGKLALADALPILRAIARALDACHAKGIAHRDLKPANIFVAKDPDGTAFPKLLDFGIAKLMANANDSAAGGKSKTQTGIPMGTPYYMSPEQCRGRDVDHRTDYYAFGIVAYEMLTGRIPFDGDDYMAVLLQQINELPDLSALPPGIDDAIGWLVQKDPAARPPSLIAAVEALEATAAASGIQIPVSRDSRPIAAVKPPTPARIAARPALTEIAQPNKSRAPLVVGIAAGVAVLGVVCAIVLMGAKASDPAKPQAITSPSPAPPIPTNPTATAVAPDASVLASIGVTINITGTPDGTEVLLRGNLVGTAPGPVQLDRGAEPVVLMLRADGFAPMSKTITPDRDQDLAAPLKKKLAPPPVKHPSRDDIATPDFH